MAGLSSVGMGLPGQEQLPAQSFSGWEPKKLFARGEGARFTDTAWSWGFDSRTDGRSLVAVDADGDGDLDLLMSNRNAPRLQLFENVGTGNHALELDLQSTLGHPEADGAVVLVEGQGAFAATLGRGYVSAVSPRVHVGLGAKTSARVRVRWRSGATEDFGEVKAGAVTRLREGTGKAQVLRPFVASPPAAPPPWPARVEQAVEGASGPHVVQLFLRACVPCREEVPALNALHAAGVQVTGLGLHAAAELEAAKADLGQQYPVRTLPEAVGAAFEGPDQGLALPTVLVYGADGALARVVPGGKQLEPVLQELGLVAAKPAPKKR